MPVDRAKPCKTVQNNALFVVRIVVSFLPWLFLLSLTKVLVQLLCRGVFLALTDAKTGDRVLYKKGKRNDFGVSLSKSERATVKAHAGPIIALHNHPTNIHPTGSDFVTAASRKYEFGFVATHDGRVFKYTPPKKKIDARSLDDIIDFHTRHLYNDDEKVEGFKKALDEICRKYGATWEELL